MYGGKLPNARGSSGKLVIGQSIVEYGNICIYRRLLSLLLFIATMQPVVTKSGVVLYAHPGVRV